jgi:hypothetical protein
VPVAVLLVVVGWLYIRSSCAPSLGAIPADSTGLLIDPARVHADSKTYTLTHVFREGEPEFALDSMLRHNVRGRALRWTVDAKPVPTGRFRAPCEPAANHAGIHRIAVTDGKSRDGFVLVVIPSATAAKFDTWLRAARQDMAWLQTLPPVYTHLLPGGANPEPDGCRPKVWPVLRRIGGHYHPGAAYEMRSAIQSNGSGHQATYDVNGQLLRLGTGAGSADRAAPRTYSIFRLIAHRDQDVLPFLWAAQLDGNPVNPRPFYTDFDVPLWREGDHLRAYMSVRPTNPAQKEIPAGMCADGRAP